MALSPLDRPQGSSHVLRYRGIVAVGQSNANVYPQVAGVIPANSTVTGASFQAYVRFPLFDASDLTDLLRQLPLDVYDDTVPAPHDDVACVPSATPGVNATDLSMNRETWAQNVEITVRSLSQKLEIIDSGVAVDNNIVNGVQIVRDTLTSGMGLNTGLPVVIIGLQAAANDGEIQAFPIDITIEVRHSVHR